MLSKTLLKKIQEKNPKYSIKQIELVLMGHLGTINRKLINCQKINLNIPKLGRIHTHGNVKHKSTQHTYKLHKAWTDKKNLYSDEQLLF